MTRIPFALFPFPDSDLTEKAIERHLRQHLVRLIASKIGMEPPLNADGTIDEAKHEGMLESIDLPYAKTRRLRDRAARIVERQAEKSPLSRMKAEDRKRIMPLRDGVALIGVPNEHRADELAAALHAEFPWMGAATETVWHAMRRSVQRGDEGPRLPPILLDGPPGIGKSHWARRLGTLIGVPGMVYDATTENASFGLVGCQRGWGNSAPGRLVNLILTERVANPVVVVDEVEKAGTAQSDKGRSFDLTAALLPLLEPLSARNWTCPYFELPFDMGWIIWVLTSNDCRLLPDPLLSRCPPIRLDPPVLAHLLGFAAHEGERRGLSPEAIDAIRAALEWAERQDRLPTLRTVLRMLDRAEQMQQRPPLQ